MSDLERAQDAITEVFNDTSVSQSETRMQLKDLIEFIQDMVNTLSD